MLTKVKQQDAQGVKGLDSGRQVETEIFVACKYQAYH